MNRSRRDSRQHNGITPQGLSQPTFATKSARNGHGAMSDLSPLCAPKRTSAERAWSRWRSTMRLPLRR